MNIKCKKMVKPKFSLKVKCVTPYLNTKPNSKAEAIIHRKNINLKENQIEKAVQWCIDNNKKGHAALKTGMFPLIKDRETIDRQLNGTKMNIKKEHLRILTLEEEMSIVQYVKNKNRCRQGVTKNTRVTNVHGSMEAQDILSQVQSIENEKKEKLL